MISKHGTSAADDGGKPPGRFVYIAAGISALGGLLFGYDTGVISGAILFIKNEFALSAGREEAVVSAVLIGAVVGAAAGGPLADRFGRRLLLIVSAALFGLGAIGTALAPSLNLLIAGRVIVGAAIGAASFIAPLYISEISPHVLRGRLVSLNQIALTSGIVISYLVDYALSGAKAWRWMLGLAVIPAAALAVGMIFMPPSPRWLVHRDRRSRASAVLMRIRGTPDVDAELADIDSGLGRQGGSWRDLLGPMVRPALIIGIGLAIFQQITGINTVIYYAPIIFEYAGFRSASAAILATTGVGVVNVIMTVVAAKLLDRAGRRPLLLAGLGGMAVSLGALGGAFSSPASASGLGKMAVAGLMIYVGTFAVGLGPVFWLLISEIYPQRVRGRAMGLATIANWAFNWLVASTFLSLVRGLGKPGTFWLFAAVCVGAWLFSYKLVPETKGKSLEEIEAHWRAGKSAKEMSS